MTGRMYCFLYQFLRDAMAVAPALLARQNINLYLGREARPRSSTAPPISPCAIIRPDKSGRKTAISGNPATDCT
jgi:hypothetical protein